METNYKSLATVAIDTSIMHANREALAIFPFTKVNEGDFVKIEANGDTYLGMVSSVVSCIQGDPTYRAMVNLHGRPPMEGIAVYSCTYSADGEGGEPLDF